MDFLYKTDTVVNALGKFLEDNSVDKNAKYSEDVLMIDMVSGYYEQLLRLKVKPAYLTLDGWTVEAIAAYMEEDV